MDLFPDNFYTQLSKNKYSFVLFYAPWCPHCKPVLELLPEAQKKEPSVTFFKYNASDNVTPQEVSVYSFPTMAFFNNGKITYYDGERTVRDIVRFCRLIKNNKT